MPLIELRKKATINKLSYGYVVEIPTGIMNKEEHACQTLNQVFEVLKKWDT
jgi:hypothetical protein